MKIYMILMILFFKGTRAIGENIEARDRFKQSWQMLHIDATRPISFNIKELVLPAKVESLSLRQSFCIQRQQKWGRFRQLKKRDLAGVVEGGIPPQQPLTLTIPISLQRSPFPIWHTNNPQEMAR